MVFRFRVNGWHEVFKIVGAYIMCRPTITELHHYYLIMIRMLLEVTSLSYKIIVLIIILENFSSARIVNTWNSLPNYVVDVQSIDIFKVRLDKFWAQQEVMFDWTADLTGTGDRSEYTVESY